MNKLIIIVEGNTEEEFVNTILKPYFRRFGIDNVICFKIKHSKGGLSKYEHLRTDILNCIYDEDCLITTLIDYYAIPKDFPGYQIAHQTHSDKNQILAILEKNICEDINIYKKRQLKNLLPYIQLHEFEALIFACSEGIKKFFIPSKIKTNELNKILKEYPNPELINDSPSTAPSKRLIHLIHGYNKVIDGVNIISEIGIETILEKCPRFRIWIEKIISEFQS